MAATSSAAPALDHVIRDAAELTQRMADWQKAGYHVLSPASQVSAFGESYGVMVNTVLVHTDPAAGEVYNDRACMQGDELALTRIGLQRIEQLAGLSWLPGASRRTDDRLIQNLWEYESWAAYLTFDGTPRTVKGTAEVDLREGSAQIGRSARCLKRSRRWRT